MRDAIHVATIWLEAGEDLEPGDRVQVVDGKVYKGGDFGILDPWSEIYGDRVQVWVNPKNVVSLRHDWICVGFDSKESEKWIREFAAKIGYSYETVMEAAEKLAVTGEVTFVGQDESYKDGDWVG